MVGEIEKDLCYCYNVESTRSLFYPLVLESLGLRTSSSLEILKDIARKTTHTNGLTIRKTLVNIHEQLSITLWKYNAKMFRFTSC